MSTTDITMDPKASDDVDLALNPQASVAMDVDDSKMSVSEQLTKVANYAIKVLEYAKTLGLEAKTIKKIEQLSNLIDITDGDNPFYMVALLLKICKAIGEFMDLLGQSDDSYFGYKHNNSTRNNGINHPIQKIIDELRAILSGPKDNKYAKRQERFDFFKAFAPDGKDSDTIILRKYFNILFSKMCNYLNGGKKTFINGKFIFSGNEQYSAKIVITASGGNLITIYAQLVQYYLTPEPKKKNKAFEEIITAFEEYSGFKRPSEIKGKIEAYVKDTQVLAYDDVSKKQKNVYLAEQIKTMSNKSFSDLDTKIGANKDDTRPTANDDPKNLSDEVQFSLLRAKIEKLCNINSLTKLLQSESRFDLLANNHEALQAIRKENETRWQASCHAIATKNPHIGFDASIVAALYPGQMKEDYLNSLEDQLTILEDELRLESIIQDMIIEYTLISDPTEVDSQSAEKKRQIIESITEMKRCLKYLLSLSIRKDANDKATASNIATMSDLILAKVLLEQADAIKTNNTHLKKAEMEVKNIQKEIKTTENMIEKWRLKKTTNRGNEIKEQNIAQLEEQLVKYEASLIEADAKAKNYKSEQIELNEKHRTQLDNIPSRSEQFIELIRNISIVANEAIEQLLISSECTWKNIDECFATIHTMMTVPIGGSDLTVIDLQTKVLSRLLIDEDGRIKISEMLRAIERSDTNSTLGASSTTTQFSNIPDDEKHSDTDIMRKIQTILEEVLPKHPKGIRALAIVIGKDTSPVVSQGDSSSSSGSQMSDGPGVLPQSSQSSQSSLGLHLEPRLVKLDSAQSTSSHIPFFGDNLKILNSAELSEGSSQGSLQSKVSSLPSISEADEFIEGLSKYMFRPKQQAKAPYEPNSKYRKRGRIITVASQILNEARKTKRKRMRMVTIMEGGTALEYKDNIKLSTKKKKFGSNKTKKPKKYRKSRKSRKSKKHRKQI